MISKLVKENFELKRAHYGTCNDSLQVRKNESNSKSFSKKSDLSYFLSIKAISEYTKELF